MIPFEPTGQGLDIFNKRYPLYEGETWDGVSLRVATCVAAAETGSNIGVWRAIFYDAIRMNELMPGGRILYGSGRPRGQLLNCFVAPTQDSREGWGRTISDVIVISGTGGGVGLNGSPIRPRGTPIAGTGGEATGAVSLFEIVDAAGNVIKAGGGRRTALMLCLNISHGDIIEFLDKKLDLKQLPNANVSIVFEEDPEAFFKLVRERRDFELKFNGQVIGKAPAHDLWLKAVTNAAKSGEPGLLNGYLANKMSNIWYVEPLISTNPCGEIWLSAYDCCCLTALVLPRFVNDGQFDWHRLAEVVKVGVRFLDNVLTVNNYPLPEIAEKCKQLRRIGLGVMGLHDMLLLLGHKYNSPEGLEFVNKLMKFIKNTAYEASVDLAIERGPFPAFHPKFLQGNFIKTLRPTLRKKIEKYGIRNCALLTIAPTGTTAAVVGVSSGIESLFAAAYIRAWRKGEELVKEPNVHPLFKQFVEEGRDVSHFQGTFDLSLRDHLEMQRVCQKHIDNAVSKTINIVQGTSIEELSDAFMEYLPDLKGLTVYPDGSRENQPLSPLTIEEALNLLGAETGSASLDGCRNGVCDF